jgi:hypothetical protein
MDTGTHTQILYVWDGYWNMEKISKSTDQIAAAFI